jgi:hypothetical protein
MIRYFLLLLVVCSTLWYACGNAIQPVAGTGSTGEAKITGVAVYPDGALVQSGTIILRPFDYQYGVRYDSVSYLNSNINDSGYFELSGIAPGTYTCEIIDTNNNATLFRYVINYDSICLDTTVTLYPTTSINGAISIASENGVDIAQITALGTDHNTTTDSAGRFSLHNMPLGVYTLRVIPLHSNFPPFDLDSVTIDSSHPVTLDPVTISFSDGVCNNYTCDSLIVTMIEKRTGCTVHTQSNSASVPPGEQRIIQLLFDGKLNGNEIPSSIGYLSSVTKLWMGGIGLNHLPREIGTLTQLYYFDIGENNLKEIPEEIGGCAKLELLYADNNNLVSLPHNLQFCKKLRVLGISNNQLTALPDYIGSFDTLTHVLAAANKLESISDSITNLSTLQVLVVGDNLLTALPKNLGDCAMLSELYLNDNALGSLPESLIELSTLTKVRVQNNKLCSLSDRLSNWLRTFDPEWASTQTCD